MCGDQSKGRGRKEKTSQDIPITYFESRVFGTIMAIAEVPGANTYLVIVIFALTKVSGHQQQVMLCQPDLSNVLLLGRICCKGGHEYVGYGRWHTR